MLVIGTDCIESYRGMLAIPRFARAVTIGYRLNMMEASGCEVKFIQNLLRLYTLNKSMMTSSSILHKSWDRKYQYVSVYISYGGYFVLNMTEHSDHFSNGIRYGVSYYCDESTSVHYSNSSLQTYSTNCGSRYGINAYGIVDAFID
mgnify:FL=1